MEAILSGNIETSTLCQPESGRSKNLMPLAIIAGAFGVTAAIFMPFLSPALRRICLPYVPATPKQLDNITTFLKPSLQQQRIQRRALQLVDLGSGDGRVVFECALASAQFHQLACTGVELNYWLVFYSRVKALKLSSSLRPKFLRQDLFNVDLARYDFVVLFGVDSMMQAVAEKVVRELPDEAFFIACRYALPSQFIPFSTVGKGIDKVWVYRGSDLRRQLKRYLELAERLELVHVKYTQGTTY